MAQVAGKVVYPDGVIPKAALRVVRFQPAPTTTAEIRKAASAQIQDDGSFEMWTQKPGDGVYYGAYTVTFLVMNESPKPQHFVADKYRSPITTPYTVTVDGDKPDLTFEVQR